MHSRGLAIKRIRHPGGGGGRAAGADRRKWRSLALFDLSELRFSNPKSELERDARNQLWTQYLQQYRSHLAGYLALSVIGLSMCVLSLLCINLLPLRGQSVLCVSYASVLQVRAQLSSPAWALILLMYYLRYPGPVLAGTGLFMTMLTVLFVSWLVDRDIKRAPILFSNRRFVQYDKLIRSRTCLSSSQHPSPTL